MTHGVVNEGNAGKINFFLHKKNVEVKFLLSHQTLFIQQETKKRRKDNWSFYKIFNAPKHVA